MSIAPPPLDYAAPQILTGGTAQNACPLCVLRPATKTLYGSPVCKKCLYKFANRRQLAYLVDSILFAIPVFAIFYAITPQLLTMFPSDAAYELATTVIAVVFQTVFAMKDGINGQSPGKMLTGVQVIDVASGRPISFLQSFKRNCVFLLGTLPFIGQWASLVIVITIIVQMNKGPRLGDRFAKTLVIWKRYADLRVFGGSQLQCHKCGYDLTGNQSGVCPECGAAIVPQAAAVV